MADNNTFISSIFSKVKKEKNKPNNVFFRTIGDIKYKYTLFKAKDDGCYHRDSAEKFSYIERADNVTFHILDDEFGVFLYNLLKNKEIDFENAPDEFKGMSFIAVRKLQKVVFVSFNITEENKYLLREYHEDVSKITNNVYESFDWLEETISFEGTFLNIDYAKFFEALFEDDSNFLLSLFKAVCLSDKPYQLNKEILDKIIDSIFVYYSRSAESGLESLRRNMELNTKPFYQFVNQGVYMKELESDSILRCLPENLRINVLNYIKFEHNYDNLKEIFKCQRELAAGVENFIFNQALFEESVKVIQEDSKFITYKNKDDKNFGYFPAFIKIQDEAEFEVVKQTIDLLVEEKLISNVSLVYSDDDGAYYICDYNDETKQIKLSDYIKGIDDDENEIHELLLKVNDTFSSKPSIKQKIFMKEDADYLQTLYLDEVTHEVKFASITSIMLVKEKDNKPFYYPLCMMQIVERFLMNNNMDLQDLYKCEFIKLFPQAFTASLIDYINTKTYKDKGMAGKLKGIIERSYESKFEFLENIDLADENLLQRISFVPSAKENFPIISTAVNIAKNDIDLSKKAVHLALDDYMDFVTKQKDLSLSKALIERLTTCCNYDRFLIPEKLIISKDVYNEKNYTVVGVIWSKSKLYRLSDLIAAGDITTKNIYSTVIRDIMKMWNVNLNVDKLNNSMKSLLVDDKYNVVIDCNSYKSINDVVCEGKTLKAYYTGIMKSILAEYGDKLENFTYFTCEQLFMGNFTFDEAFDKIKFCHEHKRLYLSGEMCEECQKIYAIVDDNTGLELVQELDGIQYYSMRKIRPIEVGVGAYEFEKGIVWHCLDNDVNKIAAYRAKTGIENAAYEKFIALVPQKIAIKNYDGDREIVGVLLSDYDFSNMIDINELNYVQRLKVVLMLYKKILPYIEDSSFVAATNLIFSTIFMDKNHKGEFILPNLSLLGTDNLGRISKKHKKEEKEKTLKLFSEFLYNYLTSDEGLCVEMNRNEPLLTKVLQSIKDCDFKEKYIRDYLATKDAYCLIHAAHFKSSDGLCPECIAEGIETKDAIILPKSYFDNLKAKASNFEGGEANLYFNEDGTIDKIFNDEVSVSFKSKILGKALQKEKAFDEFNKAHEDIKFASIYKVLYSFENGMLNLEGYRQEYIPDSFKISSFKDKNFVEEKGYTRKDIVEILIKVCQGIEFLHSIGGFIGDLNGGNILIKDKNVYFIDKDGMSFDDVRNCVYTNLYIYPPSAENKNITKADDWYSFAIQVFYYLTYSHPFRGVSDKSYIPVNELERMKHGYSVLGNHGIKLPSVSIGWDLMPNQMVEFFLATFENTKRESMLQILQSYLKHIIKNEMSFSKVIRQREVAYEIDENIYIAADGQLYFKEEFRLNLTELTDYDEHVAFSGNYVVISTDTQVGVINSQTGSCYIIDKAYEEIEHVYDNTIYYTMDGDTNVYVDEFNPNTKQISTHILKRATQNPIWTMDGYNNKKFVLLERNDTDNTYDIYCNMTKVHSFSQDEEFDEASATILHDEITDKWLVIITYENTLKGFVVDKTGKCSSFTLNMDVELTSGYCFYKNTLYFVSDKKIYMYSISKNEIKTVYSSIVTSTANIERKDNKFIVSNEKSTYVYEKS